MSFLLIFRARLFFALDNCIYKLFIIYILHSPHNIISNYVERTITSTVQQNNKEQ